VCGWPEVSRLDLMEQPVCNLDFGIRREAGRRIAVAVTVVQFNLEHDELLLLEGSNPSGPCMLTCISRASNEMPRQDRPRSRSPRDQTLDVERSVQMIEPARRADSRPARSMIVVFGRAPTPKARAAHAALPGTWTTDVRHGRGYRTIPPADLFAARCRHAAASQAG
jgi:hypothetical protein